MWFRRPSVQTFFILVLVASILVVLLVAWHNGPTDYGHTPLIHNTLLNIQQKVLKSEHLSKDEARHKGGKNGELVSSLDSSQVSSSNYSDDEVKEQVSELTGDNAKEVRVSSSTNQGHRGSEGDTRFEAPPAGGGKEAHEKERKLRSEHDSGEERTNQRRVTEGEGDEADKMEDSRHVHVRRSDFHHNWNEYNPSAWETLPLLPSKEEAEAQRGDAVFYNRVGKCGSRSVISVMREIAMRNQFHFVSSLVYNKTSITPEYEEMIVNIISRLKRPYIFQRHIHFVDFRRYSMQQPKYINIIRDPLSRMVSQYYFKRFGDGKSERVYKGTDRYQTFDECVLNKKEECLGKKSFYIIPFFCGQDPRCKEPSRWSLDEAVKNLKDHYVATGLLEELEDTFRVFERVLPGLFDGASVVYRKTVSGELTANISSMFTKHKVKPSTQVARIMKGHMRFEYSFYELVKQRFHTLKQELGLS